MSRTAEAGRSIYEQMTEGLRLPLPPIPARILEVIVQALAAAWTRIPPSDTAVADEASLNAMMEAQLNHALDAGDELESVIAAVGRGKETINYNGTRLEERPDLSIVLMSIILMDPRRPRSFPLVVECKLIDHPADKTVRLYCKHGLQRFIEGDYGWAGQEGVLLAYVRDGSTITTALSPYLERHRQENPERFRTESMPEAIASNPQQAVSRHGRAFRYPGRAPLDDPGPIRIRHVWLGMQSPHS